MTAFYAVFVFVFLFDTHKTLLFECRVFFFVLFCVIQVSIGVNVLGISLFLLKAY